MTSTNSSICYWCKPFHLLAQVGTMDQILLLPVHFLPKSWITFGCCWHNFDKNYCWSCSLCFEHKYWKERWSFSGSRHSTTWSHHSHLLFPACRYWVSEPTPKDFTKTLESAPTNHQLPWFYQESLKARWKLLVKIPGPLHPVFTPVHLLLSLDSVLIQEIATKLSFKNQFQSSFLMMCSTHSPHS